MNSAFQGDQFGIILIDTGRYGGCAADKAGGTNSGQLALYALAPAIAQLVDEQRLRVRIGPTDDRRGAFRPELVLRVSDKGLENALAAMPGAGGGPAALIAKDRGGVEA